MRTLLAKAGLDELQLACGAHWPIGDRASRELMRAGQEPERRSTTIARANMPACWRRQFISVSIRGAMSGPSTPCSKRSGESFQRLAELRWKQDAIGIDGCSVPTFALPLAAVATASPGSRSGRGLERRRGLRRHGGSWTPALPRRTSLRARAASTPSSCAGSRRHCLRQGRRRRRPLRGIAGARDRRRRQGRRRHQARARRWRLPCCSPSSSPGAEPGPCRSTRRRDAHLARREGGHGWPVACAQGRGPRVAPAKRCRTAAAPR